MAKLQEISIPYNWDPRDYQIPVWAAMDAGVKRIDCVWHRRAGKDLTFLNRAIVEAHRRVGTYYHMMPKLNQARKAIWDGMDKHGRPFLDYIPKEIIRNRNESEMQVELKCGSVWQLVGADNYDNLMSTNAVGIVFSEFSLCNPRAWDFFRPILRENGGWAAFLYCVSPDTLVLTESGLKRIGNIYPEAKKGFTDIDLNVYGLNGFHKAKQFFSNGLSKNLNIVTKSGYKIICTPNHQLWNGKNWKRSDQFNIGDKVPIQRGQQVWGNEIHVYHANGKYYKKPPIDYKLNESLSYILGLWLAEGSYQSDYGAVITTKFDRDLDDTLIRFGFKTNDKLHYVLSSKGFVDFLKWFGMNAGAKNKRLPDKLFSMPKDQVSAFLRGYFDGDGCATLRGTVHCDSASEGLIDDLQILLLNYGIVSSKRILNTKPTKKVNKECRCYRIEITGHNVYLYYEQIGFKLQRKNQRKKYVQDSVKAGYGDFVAWPDLQLRDDYLHGLNMTDLKRHEIVSYRVLQKCLSKKANPVLQKVIDDNYYYDEIAEISETITHTCDFVIPDTHSFFSNGFISHNTPRGRNHAYDLHTMASRNPAWFSETLTVKDTGIVPSSDIEEERQAGMTEDMIQQEFFCSFDAAVPGAYYASELRRAREQGRITKVPFQGGVPVDTWWDLGIDDSMSIWFTQDVGREIHLIKYFEHRGEGLEYYAAKLGEFIQEWGGIYGRHTAPHDITVREIGTGKTRLKTAGDLGLKFDIAQRPARKEDGHQAVRNIFPLLWFDEQNCRQGLDGLASYHSEYDEKNKVLKAYPVHDWASHPADSAQTLALRHQFASLVRPPERPKYRSSEQSWM